MFSKVTALVTNWPLRVNGSIVPVGTRVRPGDFKHLDALLSRRMIVPEPDPHGRKTKSKHPTATYLPPKWYQHVVKGVVLRNKCDDIPPGPVLPDPVEDGVVEELVAKKSRKVATLEPEVADDGEA